MFGGGPTRNMVNLQAKNLPTEWEGNPAKNVLWKADLGSRAYGGPTVAGGKVFVGTNNQKPRNPKNRDAKGNAIDLGVLMVFNQADGKFAYETTFEKLKSGQVCDWPLEGLCSTPTAEGKFIYYTSNRCEVICEDMTNGKLEWKLDMIKDLGVFPHNLTASCPLIVGDDLYLVTANGVDEGHINVPRPRAPSFLKLNKKDGKVLWQDNSPTIKMAQADEKQAANSDFLKTLVNRGELIQHGQWSNPAYAVVKGQPQIIWPGGEGWIYSFDPDGKLLWKFDCNPKDAKYELGTKGTRSDFVATPVIYKDRVYIGIGQDPEHLTGVGHLWCIDMTRRGDVSPELVTDYSVWPPKTKPNPNSAKVWHYGGFVKDGKRKYEFGRTMSTCAIHDDLLYTSELEGIVHCLDANTGKLLWQHDTKESVWSSPYWADGKVYLGTDSGTIYVFAHGKEKKLLAENELLTQPVRASPVAVGDVLYVICGNTLFALKKQ
jgi:outer membrane protein assembly factor BamB